MAFGAAGAIILVLLGILATQLYAATKRPNFDYHRMGRSTQGLEDLAEEGATDDDMHAGARALNDQDENEAGQQVNENIEMGDRSGFINVQLN